MKKLFPMLIATMLGAFSFGVYADDLASPPADSNATASPSPSADDNEKAAPSSSQDSTSTSSADQSSDSRY